MHTDMTAVTIQFNKIVLNEVKDNSALIEPSYRKKPDELFGQSNTLTLFKSSAPQLGFVLFCPQITKYFW